MPSNANLHTALTRLKLRRLAGARSFELGSEYFSAGRVLSWAEEPGRITGVVHGTTEYDVTLAADGDALSFQCTCPMAAEGGFCKHCVALGLAWLSGEGDEKPTRKQIPTMTPAEMRAWLAQKDKSALIEIILARAATDARFRNQLLLDIANAEEKDEEAA